MKPGDCVTWLDADADCVATGRVWSVSDDGHTAFIKLVEPMTIRGGTYVVRHVVDLTAWKEVERPTAARAIYS